MIGAQALWFALLAAAASAVLSAVALGQRHTSRASAGFAAARALFAAAALGTFTAVGAMWAALLGHDFSVRYVAQYTSALFSREPALAALWAGEAGTLMWCAAMVAACGLGAIALYRRQRSLIEPAVLVLAVVLASAVAACLTRHPFLRLATVPTEGRGLPPQLLHHGMLGLSPLLLLGLAMTTVPFAWVAAALWRGEPLDTWRTTVRRWLLASWMALTLALGVGLWWAQQQLGWYGYFFTWEPFASAPMLPWLALTALLIVFASGADRVRDTVWVAAFVAFAFLLAVAAVVRAHAGLADSIRAVDARPSTWLLVMVGIGVLLVAALGVLAIRTSRGAVRTGGVVTLVGAVLLASGLGGSLLRRDTTASVDIGEVLALRDPFRAEWRLTSQGVSSYQEPAYTVLAVVLSASRDGHRAGLLTSQQRQYFDANDNEMGDPTTKVGSIWQWHQVVTVGFLGPINRTAAAVRVSFVPLVNMVAVGLVLLLLGVPLAVWPTNLALAASSGSTQPEPSDQSASSG